MFVTYLRALLGFEKAFIYSSPRKEQAYDHLQGFLYGYLGLGTLSCLRNSSFFKLPPMESIEKLVIKYDKDSLNTIELTIHGECHTIGNLVRDQVLKSKSCTFCGYKVPHPQSNFVSLRISAVEDKPVRIMVIESLRALSRDIEMLTKSLRAE